MYVLLNGLGIHPGLAIARYSNTRTAVLGARHQMVFTHTLHVLNIPRVDSAKKPP